MGHSPLLSFLTNVSLSGHNSFQTFHLAIIEQLIRSTFNGYDCLNIYAEPTECREAQNYYGAIIQRAHALNSKVFVPSSLADCNQHCGYLLLTCGVGILPALNGFIFDRIVRILLLQLTASNSSDLLERNEFRLISKEKDIVLAFLPRVSTDALKLHVKSRYELETRFIDDAAIHSCKPFFHSRNDYPNDIRPIISLTRRPIKLTTFNCPIYSSIIDGELTDGVETRIYREIERKFNLTTELVIPNDGKRWGTTFPNGTISGGILKILHERRADIGLCSIWIEDTKLASMRLSTYWDVVCLAFLVPKPKRLPTQWYNVFTPVPQSIWIMVLVAITVTWTACGMLNFLETRLISKVLRVDNSITSELLILTGILLHAKNPEFNHGTRVTRYVYMCWSIFALVVTSQYSTSLVSHLTYPNYESISATIEDLVKHGYYWGTPYEIMMSAVFNMDNPWHRKFVNSFMYEKSHQDRLDNLSKGNYSILVHRIGYRHFMEVYNIPVDILRELRTTRACNGAYFYLSFAYSLTFPLADLVDTVIMRLVESGITKYWLNRVFERKYPLTTFTKVYEFKTPREDIGVTALGLDNLKGAFLIWTTGILLALVMLAGEILADRRKRAMGDKMKRSRRRNIYFEMRVDTLMRDYQRVKMKLK